MGPQRSFSESTNAVEHMFVWPRTLLERVEAFSAAEDVDVFVVLLTAFETLLHRYTGLDRFSIRCSIPGGLFEERRHSSDPFADAAVLYGEFRDDMSFRDALGRVRVALNGTRDDPEDVDNAQGQIHLDNSSVSTPFPRILFGALRGRQVFQQSGLSAASEGPQPKPCDLSLVMWSEAGLLNGRSACRTHLFDEGTIEFDQGAIERMVGHLQTLLDAAVERPDEPIWRLPVLTDRERKQILIEWNDTGRSYPADKCVHELFEAQVERFPDNVAAVFEDFQLSYRTLNARANQLAHHLRAQGIGAGSLAGVYVREPLEQIVALLGVLKAGGAYVPLDPAYPRHRLKSMLEDAGVSVLVTQKHLSQEVPGAGPSRLVVCLDGDWVDDADSSLKNPQNATTPDGLAYVLYTSGSTGRPKGIPITHRSVANLLNSMQRELQLTSQDRLLAVTTINFDMAVLEIYLPLVSGASVAVVDRATAVDGDALARRASNPKVTVMQATPATWRLLLEAGWTGNSRLQAISGGEAMSRDLAGELSVRCASLWNMYGPTETTVYSSVHKVVNDARRIPIGRPIGNTRIYILDRHLQPRPIGMPGEIYIGGVGVARGYLHRPELTTGAFIPDVFNPGADARLYKTGDYARYRADGEIEYLGRIDHQIKIRGFRIEAEEVELALQQHPAVQQAVVSAREDVPGDRRLVAYVVTRPGRQVSTTDLLNVLHNTLPQYMVPSELVFLEKLPLTPNGKIDRRALPDPEGIRPAFEQGYVAPRNESERRLAAAWEAVLRKTPIGVRDNFFDLGGDSLLAVRLTIEIEEAFGARFSPAGLYQAQTIEQLANFVGPAVAPTPLLIPLQADGSRPPFFWFHGDYSNVVLPRYLGDEQPLYGVLHQGHDGQPARYTTVESMANHFMGGIRFVQPHGPYCVGGYCFGGIVAFEIARRLQNEGESVELVALLDPDNFTHPRLRAAQPSTPRRTQARASSRDRIRRHLDALMSLKSGEMFDYCRVRAQDRISQLRFVRKGNVMLKTAFCNICFALRRPLPAALYSHYMLRTYAAAMRRYVPGPYSGRLLIWRSIEGACDDAIWKRLSRQVEINEIDGNHSQVLREPYIRAWAEQLGQELRDFGSRIRLSKTLHRGFGLVAALQGAVDYLTNYTC